MTYTCREVCRQIEEFAPPQYALEGDPIGLHLGSYSQKVDKLFMALELTPDVLQEALEWKPDMIFVHHTPFFSAFKQLRDDDGHNSIVLALIREGVALYTAHTNLDSVIGGVNDALAGLLGIHSLEILQPLNQNIQDAGLGRIGALKEPMPLEAFARLTADKLGAAGVRYAGDKGQSVSKVACCGGAGAFLMTEAKARGADTYVTSDAKHHDGIQAIELGLALVDAGHFTTENPAVPALAAYLKDKMPGLAVSISALSGDPFSYV